MRHVSTASVIASEAVQREAWRILSCSIPPSHASTLGISAEQRAGALHQAGRGIAVPQFNKVFSFGVEGDLTDDDIAFARDWLVERCAGLSFVMVPPVAGRGNLDDRMARFGLGRHPLDYAIFQSTGGGENRSTSPGLDVRPVSPDEATAFGEALCGGLGIEGVPAVAFSGLIGQPGMTGYVAWGGPVAMGAASLFVSGGWGWLWLAATRPEFRRSGVQSALLARRIADGRAAGVHTFNVAALHPAAEIQGDLFASYRNIRRAGFELAYRRPNYVISR